MHYIWFCNSGLIKFKCAEKRWRRMHHWIVSNYWVVHFVHLRFQCVCVCRLLRQVPAAMSEVCVQWSTLVYPLLLHPNPKLRERAVLAMDSALPIMMCQQTDVAKCLASDLKDVRPPMLYVIWCQSCGLKDIRPPMLNCVWWLCQSWSRCQTTHVERELTVNHMSYDM